MTAEWYQTKQRNGATQGVQSQKSLSKTYNNHRTHLEAPPGPTWPRYGGHICAEEVRYYGAGESKRIAIWKG